MIQVYVHCDGNIYKPEGKRILHYIESQMMFHSELI